MDGKTSLHSGLSVFLLILSVFAIADGAFLLVGLWTTFAGFLAIAIVLVQIIGRCESQCPPILLAAMGAGIAFVGPGALSIDAWLFGLKRIDIAKLEGPPPS